MPFGSQFLNRLRRKKRKGNPGNPGTSPNIKIKTAGIKPSGYGASKWTGLTQFTQGAIETPGGQKIAAMNNLVENNSSLKEKLQQITGSTKVADFAEYFATLPPAHQKQMVIESRQQTAAQKTWVDDVKEVAGTVGNVLVNASGNQTAADVKKKNITVTVAIIAGVVVVLLVTFLLLKKSTSNKKQVV